MDSNAPNESDDATVAGRGSRARRSAPGPATDEPVRLDDVFSLLGDRRRRLVLYALCDLAKPVVARSRVAAFASALGASVATAGKRPLRPITSVELHHDHLPRLEAAGLVAYDSRRGTVRYEGAPAVVEWLEHAHYAEVGRPLSRRR